MLILEPLWQIKVGDNNVGCVEKYLEMYEIKPLEASTISVFFGDYNYQSSHKYNSIFE